MSSRYQEHEPPLRVAIIGTGTMGTAMAHRLLRSGMEVGVWSRHRSSTVSLVNQGARAYAKAADAVPNADVVITMLPTAEATADVMLGSRALGAMQPWAIWAQMGTIGVEATERLLTQSLVQRPGVTFVDAPVSGSRAPAETGELLILASGPQRAAQQLEPVFGALARATLWLGPAGGGSRMKLVLNTWLAFPAEGAAEALALAERFGVPASALFAALRDNPLASLYALDKLTRMIEQDHRADFALDWASNDLDLVASEAGAGVAPIGVAIAQRWHELSRMGLSELDVRAARQGLGQGARAPSVRPPPHLRGVGHRVPSNIARPAPSASA